MTKVKRLNPNIRKDQILLSAVNLALTEGYDRIQRDGVADAAGVSAGLVTHYFDNIETLHKAVLEKAIELRLHVILLQGLCIKDPIALKAPKDLIEEARELI